MATVSWHEAMMTDDAVVVYNPDPKVPPDMRWEVFMWKRRICCCVDEQTARATAYLLNVNNKPL
jgi:hypothetical protein